MRATIRSNAEMANVARALSERRRTAPARVQRMNKNGKWGVAFDVLMIGDEKSAEDVVARLEKLNPGKQFRAAC